jgi:hypothetical protein
MNIASIDLATSNHPTVMYRTISDEFCGTPALFLLRYLPVGSAIKSSEDRIDISLADAMKNPDTVVNVEITIMNETVSGNHDAACGNSLAVNPATPPIDHQDRCSLRTIAVFAYSGIAVVKN